MAYCKYGYYYLYQGLDYITAVNRCERSLLFFIKRMHFNKYYGAKVTGILQK